MDNLDHQIRAGLHLLNTYNNDLLVIVGMKESDFIITNGSDLQLVNPTYFGFGSTITYQGESRGMGIGIG